MDLTAEFTSAFPWDTEVFSPLTLQHALARSFYYCILSCCTSFAMAWIYEFVFWGCNLAMTYCSSSHTRKESSGAGENLAFQANGRTGHVLYVPGTGDLPACPQSQTFPASFCLLRQRSHNLGSHEQLCGVTGLCEAMAMSPPAQLMGTAVKYNLFWRTHSCPCFLPPCAKVMN